MLVLIINTKLYVQALVRIISVINELHRAECVSSQQKYLTIG